MLRSEGDLEVDAFGSMICNAVELDTMLSHAPRMKESSSPLSKKRKDRECSLRHKYHLPISYARNNVMLCSIDVDIGRIAHAKVKQNVVFEIL